MSGARRALLAAGGALATWSFPRPPEESPAGQGGPRLADHRIAYLEYEGEVSGGRGRVQIHDRGTYDALEWSDARVRVALAGGRVTGTWVLEPAGATDERGRATWRVRRE